MGEAVDVKVGGCTGVFVAVGTEVKVVVFTGVGLGVKVVVLVGNEVTLAVCVAVEMDVAYVTTN